MSKETAVLSSVSAPIRTRAPYRLITIFSALTISIIMLGIFYFAHEEKIVIKENEDELMSVNDLKSMQIVNWRLERMSNARAIFNIPLFSKYIRDCLQNPGDTRLLKEFLLTLETIRNVYRLESVTAMDTRQNIISFTGKYANKIDQNEKKPIEEALKENRIIFSDLHRHDDNPEIHMDIFIPINLRPPGKETRVGLIRLHINPSEFLYPLIKSWPLSSKSGETLLVARQGDDVVFLNELRFSRDTALDLKFPINTPGLPAALAVQGVEKPIFGKDYRGVSVLAVAKKIPDSSWYLVSKIDMKELRAPLVFIEWLAALTTIFFVLFAGALIASYWNKKDADYYQLQYQMELDKKAFEKHYKYITQYANDIILLSDSDLHLVYVNDKAVATYGYSREEMIGKDISNLRPPDKREELRTIINMLTDGKLFETVHVRKDGSEFPVELSSRLIDIEGKKYYQGIIRDISERKKLEQRMEAFFTESPAGLSIVDDQQRFVKINKKMADFNGYPVEAHIGKTLMELVPKLAPQLVSIHKEIIDSGKPLLNKEISGETPLHPGQVRHWIGSYFPVPGDDIRRRYVGSIVVEITDLKRAQEELRRARDQAKKYFDIAGTMFVVLDREERVILMNKKGYDMFGYNENELFGKNWFDVCLSPDARPKVKETFHEILKGNIAPVEYYENEIITKNGERRIVAFHNSLLTNEKGEITGTLSSGEDITDRRKAEENVFRLNEELEQRVKERTAQLEISNKDLEAFSYSVSHDLRAPLRAMDRFSRMLIEDHSKSLDSEGKRILNVIISSARDMSKLIDDLLAFSRVSRRELKSAELNTGEIVKTVIDEIMSLNPGRKIDFKVNPMPPIRGDGTMIRRVFTNLIDNSVKFTRMKDTARIEIGFTPAGKENEFFVKDNGAGFDMQFADKLFGVFQRLHSDAEFEGTGVGLAIVERTISRHGGKVRAEGKPGEGAAFYFTLPV